MGVSSVHQRYKYQTMQMSDDRNPLVHFDIYERLRNVQSSKMKRQPAPTLGDGGSQPLVTANPNSECKGKGRHP
jgi:hypothetical protein